MIQNYQKLKVHLMNTSIYNYTKLGYVKHNNFSELNTCSNKHCLLYIASSPRKFPDVCKSRNLSRHRTLLHPLRHRHVRLSSLHLVSIFILQLPQNVL